VGLFIVAISGTCSAFSQLLLSLEALSEDGNSPKPCGGGFANDGAVSCGGSWKPLSRRGPPSVNGLGLGTIFGDHISLRFYAGIHCRSMALALWPFLVAKFRFVRRIPRSAKNFRVSNAWL
jgi:hypothetical protein